MVFAARHQSSCARGISLELFYFAHQVMDILSICLASLQSLNLAELFHMFSSLSVTPEVRHIAVSPLTPTAGDLDTVQGALLRHSRLPRHEDGRQRHALPPDSQVQRSAVQCSAVQCSAVQCSTGHCSPRDWLLRRRPGEATRFLCDVRTGHAAIAFSLARQRRAIKSVVFPPSPSPPGLPRPEKVLDLVHHMLKANLLKNMEQPGGQCSYRDVQVSPRPMVPVTFILNKLINL